VYLALKTLERLGGASVAQITRLSSVLTNSIPKFFPVKKLRLVIVDQPE
jgi:hypothetical protein